MISILVSRDYILRLISLASGLASIPLMYLVLKNFDRQLFIIKSLGLFALSPTLIYYSPELKQYLMDVLATLVLLLFAQKCLESKAQTHSIVALGIAGSLVNWFSHSSVFVFAGILLTLGLAFALNRD